MKRYFSLDTWLVSTAKHKKSPAVTQAAVSLLRKIFLNILILAKHPFLSPLSKKIFYLFYFFVDCLLLTSEEYIITPLRKWIACGYRKEHSCLSAVFNLWFV